MEIVFGTFFGLVAGLIVGLLPGLGTTSMLLLFFPFLIHQGILFCLIFYCVLSSTSQYFGNITALSFGVPGENTSYPLLEIRDQIRQAGKISEVQFLCSYGSLIASIFAGMLIIGLLDLFRDHVFYLKSYFSLVFALSGLLLCVCFSNNKPVTSVLLLLAGLTIGKVGYNEIQKTEFLTFGNLYLYSGIPVLPATLGLYALPCLVRMLFSSKRILLISHSYQKKFNKFQVSVLYLSTILRASTIGFVSGLIPYVGSGVSSLLAFLYEKKIKPNDFVARAVASESANNAAALSVLIPLLFLGIAIVPSEFVLLEILYSGSTPILWTNVVQSLWIVFLCLAFSNFVSFIVSWYMVNIVQNMVSYLKVYFPIAIIMCIITAITVAGFEFDQHYYYLTVLAVFFVFGLLLFKYDTLPLVYGFLLQPNIENIIYKVSRLYF